MPSRFVKLLEKAVARELKNTHGIPEWLEKRIELLQAAYGSDAVLKDFAAWAQTVKDKVPRYPVAEYLKVVDSRLGDVNEAVEDPRIVEISAHIYKEYQQLPKPGSVRRLLERYSMEDILFAFGDYTSNMDEKDLPQAVRKFFDERGADAVLHALKSE